MTTFVSLYWIVDLRRTLTVLWFISVFISVFIPVPSISGSYYRNNDWKWAFKINIDLREYLPDRLLIKMQRMWEANRRDRKRACSPPVQEVHREHSKRVAKEESITFKHFIRFSAAYIILSSSSKLYVPTVERINFSVPLVICSLIVTCIVPWRRLNRY